MNNELARFDYDFERNRLSKQGATGYQSYVYAGDQIISEHNAVGTATANYTIGAGEIVKSEFANGENNLHFTDALGSVTSLANPNGSLTARNEYDAFGLQSSSNQSANSIGYTGQRLDNETGLMALGNGERYYSPSYARFIQQDSVVGNSMMPQSLNRFSYTHNNPNKFTDPSGHIVESPWDIASLVVGLGSLGYNLYQGNYGDAAIDALGVIADAAAVALPGVPGGAGIGIKAYRAAKITVKVLQTLDRAVNVGQGIANTYKNIEEGNYGWAAVNAGLTIFGIGALQDAGRGLNRAIKVSDEVADYQRVLNQSQDVLKAKNNSEALQELSQTAAKEQKSQLLRELDDSGIYEGAERTRRAQSELGGLAEERARRISTKGDELYIASKDVRGPVLSVVKDRKTGEVFYGLNDVNKKTPSVFHPVLKERTNSIKAKYADETARLEAFNQKAKGVHPSDPGSHSEVFALNDALLARESRGLKVTEADLSDFDVYNIALQDRAVFSKGGFAPRCGNCQTITDGVYMLGSDVVRKQKR